MVILRTDIEKALDELTSQEEGMRFQGLAVVLGKQRWPELITHQRKKDFGLDAYAPASETKEKFGKGLAASITPTLKKVSDDVKRAKKNFSDLKALLFVTPAKVGNSKRKQWADAIRNDHDLELLLIGNRSGPSRRYLRRYASTRVSSKGHEDSQLAVSRRQLRLAGAENSGTSRLVNESAMAPSAWGR